MLMKDGRVNHFQTQSRTEGKERLDFLLKQTELFTQFILQSRNMKGNQRQKDLQ